jgi:beta-phosphoglucomutase
MTTMTVGLLETRVAGMSGIRAAAFDLNGTITNDEELQYEVYAEVFMEETGIHISHEYYQLELTGLSDPEIIANVLVRADMAWSDEFADDIARKRIARYLHRIRHVSPVRPSVVALIRTLTERMPVALVTGAPRAEADPILATAGLAPLFVSIITCEDVTYGKPHPQGYQLALERLREVTPGLAPQEVVVFEDSLPGIAAAHAAGMRCVGVHLPIDTAAPGADHVTAILDESILNE